MRPRQHERRQQFIDAGWGELKPGANEVGPTDTAGEYRDLEVGVDHPQAMTPEQRHDHVGPPVDVATDSLVPPLAQPASLDEAAHTFADLRHVARGYHRTASD